MAIHIFGEHGRWTVWTDCDPEQTHSGRCIGIGSTAIAALEEAEIELVADLEDVRQHIEVEREVKA